MSTQKTIDKVIDHAEKMVLAFKDKIIDKLAEEGQIADYDLFKTFGGYGYHHLTHINHIHSPLESVRILEDLKDYLETDKKLWQGLSGDEAISIQAARTYGNAVLYMWKELIDNLNEEFSRLQDEEDKKSQALILEYKEKLREKAEGMF